MNSGIVSAADRRGEVSILSIVHRTILHRIIFYRGKSMNAKDAFHQTVHNAPGGCPALAQRLGMNPTILRNKANPNNDANVVTLDDVDRVMSMTEDYSVLHVLAQAHGFVLTKIDEQPASDMAVLECGSAVWSSVGALGTAVHLALADGKIEAHELKAIEAATYAAIRPMMQLLARVNGMAEVK